ncbi:MAG TPA: OmpA family protein [Xanthomonadaceae bacterium]|jgi:OOP family OmpA-OmpF porin|nr:OmpA family protein [Xanthomonadaceae bacterium]
MKKKILCLALFGAMGAAQAVMAQDYDDRWYVDASAGFNFQSEARDTNSAPFGMLGFGKNLGSNWSLELNYNYQRPRESNIADAGHFQTQQGISLDALYHFNNLGSSNWDPYVRGGLGWQRTEDNDGADGSFRKDNFAGIFGGGLEAKYGRYTVRSEVDVRDDGNSGEPGTTQSRFGDVLASVGVTVDLGPEPMKAVAPEPIAPPPPPPPPAVKCPNVPAGVTVGPDGCPVPVTIDLRGVNFDFDKSKLRPEGIATLNEAIEVLKKYPQLQVEVAGHTDSVGSDAYNQKLSERRAKAVYQYLTSNGVDAGRLIGPHGYGKTRPIAPNTNPDGTDNPEGRAQNRRTELNVQN